MADSDRSNISKDLNINEKIRFFNGVGSWETYTANGKIPHFFMSDGPHGLRKQEAENYRDLNLSNVATCFPTASCIASSWEPEAASQLGAAIAVEALAENVNLMLGPGMNIKRSPLCGRNFEYFSEDPFLTGRLAAAYVNGMQQLGVGSCVKHFACNQQEKRRQTSSSNVDENTLRKIYLPAFEYVIKNSNPAAVMCSYNKVNGTYTCHNRHLLTEILRDEWHYEGPVISDWGACIDAAKCLKAGMDLAMPDSYGYFDTQLKIALNTKKITEEDLDKANTRLFNMIERFPGLGEREGGGSIPLVLSDAKASTYRGGEGGGSIPLAAAADASSATPSSGATDSGSLPRNAPVDFKKQHSIALSLAEKSAVLLKNTEFLPLNSNSSKKILVLGELAEKMKYQGGGSSHITTASYPNALESLKAEGFTVEYEPSYFSGFCKRSKAPKKNRPLIEKAVTAAKKAKAENTPILLFVGLTDAFEGEGFDRKDLNLPEEQLQVISKILEITDNVAVISFSGAPIDLTPANQAKAILHMYLCGEACGEAVANLVTGKINPSGKLAETWPLKIEDNPSFGNFAPENDDVNYIEGELVGYRWYEAKNIPVQYEFGYGLSYTTFEITPENQNITLGYHQHAEVLLNKLNLSEPASSVNVKVRNTGSVAGAEVVQCYYKGELCGFQKIFLEAGEEKTISIQCEILPSISSEKEKLYTSQFNEFIEKQKAHIEENLHDFTFHISHSLGDMAQNCLRIRLLLKLFERILAISNHKSMEDPSVKIEIAALYENPLESLISTSGGIITERFARKLVKWANHRSSKKKSKS